MATIAELMRARNHIAVWEQENGREASPDDLMIILYNEKVDRERRKRAAQKRRKQKTVKKKEYLSKRDKEYVLIMAACTQGLERIINDWEDHDQHPFLLRCLRTANTWIYKAMEWMLKDLPQREIDNVFREAAYHEIGIIEYSARRSRTKGSS